MASSRNETQILWAGAEFKSVAAGATEVSDAFTLDAEDWDIAVALMADNDGTPSSGDTVDFNILWTAGNIDGSAGDDYGTTEHAEYLTQLVTWPTATPGEDPSRKMIALSTTAPKGFKIQAKNNSAGRAITVRVRVITHRPQ